MTDTTGAHTGAGMHPDLEKTTSRRSNSNVPPPELLAGEADTALLGELKTSIEKGPVAKGVQ